MDEETYSIIEVKAKSMLYATYEKAYRDMLSFISSKKETLSLLSWLEWWNTRKGFIFRAFTSIESPNSNLAEVVHAHWKNTDEIRLSILHCTYNDIKASLLLNQNMLDIQNGVYDGGRGPEEPRRRKNKDCENIARAAHLGQEILDHGDSIGSAAVTSTELPETSGFQPSKKKRMVDRKKLLSNRIEKARNLKNVMKVVSEEKINASHHNY